MPHSSPHYKLVCFLWLQLYSQLARTSVARTAAGKKVSAPLHSAESGDCAGLIRGNRPFRLCLLHELQRGFRRVPCRGTSCKATRGTYQNQRLPETNAISRRSLSFATLERSINRSLCAQAILPQTFSVPSLLDCRVPTVFFRISAMSPQSFGNHEVCGR